MKWLDNWFCAMIFALLIAPFVAAMLMYDWVRGCYTRGRSNT